MGLLKEENGIQYYTLAEEVRMPVAEVIARDFYTRNPILSPLKLNVPDDTLGCSLVMFDVALKDDISVYAVDAEDGRVVGVRLSYVNHKGRDDSIAVAFGENRHEIPDHVFNANEILEYADSLCPDICAKYGVDRYVTFLVLNVAEGYDGRGIAQNLLNLCYRRHEEKGIKVVKVLASNKRTEHIFRKHGYEEVASFKVEDFKVGGVSLYHATEDVEECQVFIKQFP